MSEKSKLMAPRTDEQIACDLEEHSDYVGNDEALRKILQEAANRIRLLSVQLP